MANNPIWNDDYWLLLMQLYQKKPLGIKSEYSRPTIELAIELHLPPRTIYEQTKILEKHATPSLKRIWEQYADNPKRLTRDVKRLRRMAGFGDASLFYEGVGSTLTTEHDYRPIDPSTPLTPVMLTIILGLYFTLTAGTMVAETPEVTETARLLHIKPETVVEALATFQSFDPILKRKPSQPSPITIEAQDIWQRYCNEPLETLQEKVERLKEYFT